MAKKAGKKDRQLIKRALQALERKGRLTPDGVIDAARDPAHPLHSEFDWNDTVAAAKWRLQQARQLIASVQVFVTVDHQTLLCPVYVKDPKVPGNVQGYSSVTALTPPDRQSVLLAEIAAVEEALSRATALAVTFGLGRMVSALSRRVGAFRAAVERQRPATSA
jgi:hypothetical protein